MRISKPWLLTKSSMDDQITVLNLCFKGKTLHVGRAWYQKAVEHGFIDDLDFHLVVEKSMFNPNYPIEL